MKKIVYALLSVALLQMTACDSFLEENPRSSLTTDTYYRTEAQATASINNLYWTGAPRRITDAGSAYMGPKATLPGMLTGYFSNNYEGQEVVCRYSRLLTRQQYPSNLAGAMNDIWDPCYQAINRANAAIMYIPDIEMSESNKARLLGEARFFRAFNYFYLVKTFGGVPLVTEPSSMDALYIPRSSVEEVYALIESDLIEAVNVLPAAKFAENGHRITKYAAAMMLANVYFQQGSYSNAYTYAKIVVDSPHTLTPNADLSLNSAYNVLRSTDDVDEVIYSQEFDDIIQTGSWWPTYAFNSSATAIFGTYSIFERVYGPTNQYLNVYEEDDLRIQPNQFFHWEYTNPNTGNTWSSETAGCWYYYDENALLSSARSTKDWNFFRYAEALLVAAESLAQSSGVTAEASGYLAQIKARADINGKTADQYAAELQGLSKDAFIQECWTERLREFPLEFKIWDDCTRTGMFPVISTTQKGNVTYVPLVGATNAAGATFKESDLLWPISADELQRNPTLVQNPGY